MSFLLYNPLEAMVLILPLWAINKNRINWNNKKLLLKTFIKDCYFLGSLNLIVQIPINFLLETLFYTIYNSFICLLLMMIILYYYNIKRFYSKNFISVFIILILYYISLGVILSNSSTYLQFLLQENKLIEEFLTNLYARIIQFIIITLFGGFFMFKEKLIKNTKKNLGKTVASTVFAIGEPKLSKKLKAEVKNSK